ncbi:ATP-binding protein [Cohnella caldifontis]|uniref:ATP-binding protein n=1 Tax=Cohnella caldifontis TaxID=3027471 RepID=UPI0023EAE922|nr:ATP-binding protein [Cohnella sp. YIM B05605]
MPNNKRIKDLLLREYVDSLTGSRFSIVSDETDAYFVVDLQGDFIFASPCCKQLFGRSSSELTGMNLYDFLPSGKISIAQETAQSFELPAGMQPNGQAEVSMLMFPIFYHRELIGKFVLLNDITNLNRIETQNNLEQSILSEKLTAAGHLAAGIAHEIRNPITAIKGFLKLMKGNRADADRFYDVVFGEINRIEVIITELLLLAKPSQIKMERLNVRTLLDQTTKLMEPQALLRSVEISRHDGLRNPEIFADENQIKQVLINLMKNAIEAMADGGALRIEAENIDDAVRIRVVDNGPGIPEDVLGRIGEPFFTTKEGGTGLGVLVSKQIIENHLGRFAIQSGKDGTCVEIVLPQI